MPVGLKKKETKMKRKLLILMGVFGMAALLFMGSGCKKNEISKPSTEVLNSFDTSLVEKTNDFGFNLYKKLATEKKNSMIHLLLMALFLMYLFIHRISSYRSTTRLSLHRCGMGKSYWIKTEWVND